MKKRSFFKFNNFLLLLLFFLIFSTVACSIFLCCVVFDKDYVSYDETLFIKEKSGFPIFLDANGNEVETKFNNTQNYTKIEDIAKHTINAFIATEDKRFYTHKGVDYKRIVGALLRNVKSGKIVEGASTITQQLAKNVFLTNEKNIKRKINEIILAKKIEKNLSKDKILEIYLNTVYFGRGAYGLQRASKIFFGVNARELTVAQSAGLAGILKAPSNYSPVYNYDKFLKRKNLVLKLMLDNGCIDDELYNDALKEKIFVNNDTQNLSSVQDYFDIVVSQTAEILNEEKEKIKNRNYVIETYYDNNVQKALTNSVIKKVDNLESDRCGVVIDNKTKGIKGFFGVGDCTFWNKKINPASTIKPLGIYAPALQKGLITPITPVLDSKTSFGNEFKPKNYNDKYYGWISVRKAVANSLNVPAVKTLNVLGINECVSYLKNNGINVSNEDKNLTLALGNIKGGCNLFDLLNAYSTFGNDGNFGEYSFVKNIYLNGKLLYSHKNSNKKVFDDETVFLMTNILKDVVNYGTGKNFKKQGFEFAGKTGTCGSKNGQNSDAIFCGYNTIDSFLFWAGPKSVNDNSELLTGGNQPIKMINDYFDELTKNVNYNPKDFNTPKNVKFFNVDKNMLEKEQKVYLADENTQSSSSIGDFFNLKYPPLKNNFVNELKVAVKLSFEVLNTKKGEIKLKSNIKDTAFYIVKKNGEKYLGSGIELNVKLSKSLGRKVTLVARAYINGKICCEIKNVALD